MHLGPAEREREREEKACLYAFVCVRVFMCVLCVYITIVFILLTCLNNY